MIVNWENIRYYFQIPLDWFRQLHNFCFKSYGGFLIKLKDQGDGSKEIGIDEDEFKAAVESIATGKVKTVDSVEPNDEGDVDFGLEGSKWMKTSEEGHLATSEEEPVVLDGSEGLIYSEGDSVSYVQVGTEEGTVAAGNHNHDDQYSEKTHTHDERYSPLGHKHTTSEITDLDLSEFLTESDVGEAAFMNVGTEEGTVASGEHTHDLADMKLIVPGHSGTCLVVMDNGGNLTHSGNQAYNLINAAANVSGATKLLTDKSIGKTSGTVAEGNHTHLMADITDFESGDLLRESDIGTRVAAQSHTHTEYAEKSHTHTEYAQASHTHSEYALTNHTHSGYSPTTHTHKLEDMTLNIEGHSGTCLVVMNNLGKLTHSGNASYNLLNAAASASGVTKLLTDKSFGTTSGTAAEGNHKHTTSDITDWSTSGFLKTSDIGKTVAAQSHTHSEYASTSHTHSQYAPTNHTHSGYAQASTVESLVGVVQTIVNNYVTQGELQSVSQTATNAQQTARSAEQIADEAYDVALEAGELAESAYSPSNPPSTSNLADWSTAKSNFLTKDQLPTSFITAVGQRKSGTFTVLTNIQWTGTYLQKKTRTITVTDGLITNLGTESAWSTWETPTVISWS